jgi:serine protease
MTHPTLARCLSMLALLALPAMAAAPVSEHVNAARRTGPVAENPDRARVIVKYRADGALMREAALAAGRGEPRVAHAERMAQRHGLPMTDGHAVAPRTQVLHARGLSSSALVDRLRADPDVEQAWVDERVHATVAPNDPLYAGGAGVSPAAGQWYLRAPSGSSVSATNSEAAWSVTLGSPSIVVAVVDTGVRGDHPDLVGKLLPGYDFVSADSANDFSTANDGDGRDPDPSDPGDWVTAAEDAKAGGVFQGCGATDSSWHGTQTAGLVGALTNNGIGMASSGRNVRVLPVRALGKCGGYLSDVVAAMRWAAGLSSDPVPNPNPARIINLSLGSSGPCTGSLYQSAVADILAAGVTIVAAAGNDAGLATGRPANCPGVIGVSGLRHTGSKVGFSNIGPEVSIAAPGGNCVNSFGECLFPLLTTTNSGATSPGTNTYSDGNNASIGTSFSSPIVAGTAALMLSVNPALTPAQLRTMIQSSARAFPTTGGTAGTAACQAPSATEQLECYCTTSTCGAGMLDAGAAVTLAAGSRTTAALVFATPGAPTPGASVVVDGTTSVAASGRTITTYQWSLVGTSPIATLPAPTNGATATVNTTGEGSFTVRLTVTDSTGAQASTDRTVTVAAAPVSGGGGSSGGGAMSLAWMLGLALAVAALRPPRRG